MITEIPTLDELVGECLSIKYISENIEYLLSRRYKYHGDTTLTIKLNPRFGTYSFHCDFSGEIQDAMSQNVAEVIFKELSLGDNLLVTKPNDNQVIITTKEERPKHFIWDEYNKALKRELANIKDHIFKGQVKYALNGDEYSTNIFRKLSMEFEKKFKVLEYDEDDKVCVISLMKK